MTFRQELGSWFSPSASKTPLAPAPYVSARAPSMERLHVPSEDGRPMIITFLRHCGCPFAEGTFLNLRATADAHPDIRCIAVSHSNQSHTTKWLSEIGGAGKVEVIVDDGRDLYAAWGLGISSFMHVLSPSGLAAVRAIGKERGIWNRPTESGSRWQTAGNFGVDKEGIVRWGGVAKRADEVPDFEEAVGKVGGGAQEVAKL